MHMPVSLATGKQRQEDHYEFEANLAYMVTCRTARAIRLAETSKGEKAQTGCSFGISNISDRAGFVSCGWREEKQDQRGTRLLWEGHVLVVCA